VDQQLQQLGHEVIVANVSELRAISHGDRKNDRVDAENLARFAGSIRKSSGRLRTVPSPSRKFYQNKSSNTQVISDSKSDRVSHHSLLTPIIRGEGDMTTTGEFNESGGLWRRILRTSDIQA
jgi:transposase